MRPLLALCCLLALAVPSMGLAEGAKGVKSAFGGVDLDPVALPIVVDGRLINYIFVTVRIFPAPGAETAPLRDKKPMMQDALVRAGSRTPFTRNDDYTRVDEAKVVAAAMASAATLLGPGVVKSAQVVKQTTQRRSGLPTPPGRP